MIESGASQESTPTRCNGTRSAPAPRHGAGRRCPRAPPHGRQDGLGDPARFAGPRRRGRARALPRARRDPAGRRRARAPHARPRRQYAKRRGASCSRRLALTPSPAAARGGSSLLRALGKAEAPTLPLFPSRRDDATHSQAIVALVDALVTAKARGAVRDGGPPLCLHVGANYFSHRGVIALASMLGQGKGAGRAGGRLAKVRSDLAMMCRARIFSLNHSEVTKRWAGSPSCALASRAVRGVAHDRMSAGPNGRSFGVSAARATPSPAPDRRWRNNTMSMCLYIYIYYIHIYI